MGLSPSIDPHVTSWMPGWSTGRTLSAVRSPPSLPPLPSRSPGFSGLGKISWSALIYTSFPFVVSQNTPEGDGWVEEEGGSKMVIFKLFLVRLVHFIKP